MNDDLTPDESAALEAIYAKPGISARRLARVLQRRPESVLPVVHSLLARNRIEQRKGATVRKDGQLRNLPGLHLIVDPNLCPTCGAGKRHFEGGAECDRIAQLRLIGASLNWARVPLMYGKAIQSGRLMWDQFLNTASYDELMAGIRQARFWRDLNVQATKGAPATVGR